MSDNAANHSVFVPDPAAGGATAGAMLRRAREAAGLHVAALSVAIKVPVKKIEALEADQLHTLHDAVFVRALASSICRTLKVDAEPILKLLPQSSAPRLDTENRAINAPFRAPGDSRTRSLPGLVNRPAVWWVAALLAGVLLVAFFPQAELTRIVDSVTSQVHSFGPPGSSDPSDSSHPPQPPQSPDTVAVAVEVIPAPATVSATDPTQAGVAAPVPATPALPGSSPQPLATASQAAPVVPQAAVVATGVDAAAAGDSLRIKASGQTWVEVIDANKVVQLRKVLELGDVAVASGAAPWSVTIGRADLVQMEVRGQPWTIEGVSKNNVARFEVK